MKANETLGLIKGKASSLKGKIHTKMVVVSTSAMLLATASPVFAADDTAGIIKKLGDKVFDIFKYIGFILAIWGVGQLILAFKNDDADSKSRAIMVLVAAVLLFGMKTIFETLGISV